MKIAIEEISPVKKLIKIEVPEDVVAQEFSQAYLDLNRRVQVPGFRPGKAPLSLLEKRYAQTVEGDVIRRLVPDYYQRAIKEAQFSPVELPAIERIELKRNASLTFTATIEIKPSIKLGNYLGLRIPRQRLSLAEADVDRVLQALREKQAILTTCPDDRVIEEKDFVLLDFQGFIGGEPFEGGSGQGVVVQIGSRTFLSGFEEQLIGHRSGEQVKIQVTFPSDYRNTDLAGKEATFQVILREIKKQVLPDLDDEFAKDVGDYPSLEQLKAKIREDLSAQLKKEEDHAHRTTLVKQLIELHPFEVPPSLVEREIQESLAKLQARLPRGMTLAQARVDTQAVRAELEPAAAEKVKGRLILEAIADREGITVEKTELEESLARMGQEMKLPPEDIKRLILSREGSLEGFRARLREDKALDLVYRQTVFE